jgi:PAS domain S-box-containing protein
MADSHTKHPDDASSPSADSQSTASVPDRHDTSPLRSHAEQALQECEASFRALAENLTGFVWEATADGTPTFANQKFYDFTGVTAEQLKAGAWLDVQHPDDAPRAWQRWQRALLEHVEYNVETRFREAATGRYRWFRIIGTPVLDAEKRTCR